MLNGSWCVFGDRYFKCLRIGSKIRYKHMCISIRSRQDKKYFQIFTEIPLNMIGYG